MFNIHNAPRFAGIPIVGLALILAGCGSAPPAVSSSSEGKSTQLRAPAEAPKETPPIVKALADAAKSRDKAPGTVLSFETDPASPKIGPTKFKAHVVLNGKPVDKAVVKITTKMPEMKMDGPSGELKFEKNGSYVGSLDLTMGGRYEATLEVSFGTAHESLTRSCEVTH